jgi:hypothetical protein
MAESSEVGTEQPPIDRVQSETPATARNRRAPNGKSSRGTRRASGSSDAGKRTKKADGKPVKKSGQSDVGASPAVARAEAVLDRAGERVGSFLVSAGQRLRRTTALAREEAEDIWAEAQSVRKTASTPDRRSTRD